MQSLPVDETQEENHVREHVGLFDTIGLREARRQQRVGTPKQEPRLFCAVTQQAVQVLLHFHEGRWSRCLAVLARRQAKHVDVEGGAEYLVAFWVALTHV